MKYRLIFMIFFIADITAHAQLDSLAFEDYREQILRLYPDEITALNHIHSCGDSLSAKNARLYSVQLDSLSDMNNTALSKSVIISSMMEKYQWNMLHNRKAEALLALQNAQKITMEMGGHENFVRLNHELLSIELEKCGDTRGALASNRSLMQTATVLFEVERDSLENALTIMREDLSGNKELMEKNAKTEAQKTLYYQVAIGGAALLALLLGILLLAQSAKWKKKLKSGIDVSSEKKEELEVLSSKLNDAKNSLEQMKTAAQHTINKLNDMDVSQRRAFQSVNQLENELEQPMSELKNITEELKTTLPVATFMSLQNVLGRMHGGMKKHLREAQEVLKPK
jgi:hypothetical protein